MGETAGKPSTPSPVDSPPAIRSHTEPTNIRQPAWKWVDSIKGGLSDQLVNSFLCQSASISVLLQQFRAPDGLAGLVVVARQLRLYTVPGTLATNYIHVEQIRRENKLVISLNIDSAGCLIFFPLSFPGQPVSTQFRVTADGSWLSVCLRSRLIAPSLSFRRRILAQRFSQTCQQTQMGETAAIRFSPSHSPQRQQCLPPLCVAAAAAAACCSRNNLINIRSSSSYNFPLSLRAFARPFDVAPIETFSPSFPLVPIVCSSLVCVC